MLDYVKILREMIGNTKIVLPGVRALMFNRTSGSGQSAAAPILKETETECHDCRRWIFRTRGIAARSLMWNLPCSEVRVGGTEAVDKVDISEDWKF